MASRAALSAAGRESTADSMSSRDVRGRLTPRLGCEGGARAVQGRLRPVSARVRSAPGQRGRVPLSLAGRRLPELYLVSFWIDDPGELPVLGIVDLFQNVAAFFA